MRAIFAENLLEQILNEEAELAITREEDRTPMVPGPVLNIV
jgi:hypothetical protein